MPDAEWPALLCEYLPDLHEHVVRYVGWYSNRSRGTRTEKGPAPACVSAMEPSSAFVQRAKQAWARLIRKVYEIDPLACPVLAGIRSTVDGRFRVFLRFACAESGCSTLALRLD